MRRCAIRAVQALRCSERPVILHAPCRRRNDTLRQFHHLSPARDHGAYSRHYFVFDKVAYPEHSSESWISLLEQALPPHLRERDDLPPAVTLDAVDTAEILLAAQHPDRTHHKHEAIDVLYHLGFEKGRWNAVVWLVKELAEKFPVRHGSITRLAKLAKQWPKQESLDEITTRPIELNPLTDVLPAAHVEPRSIDELVQGPAENTTSEESLQHDAIGQIWRSLGRMTQACAGGEIKAEVLEIMAYLHHKGIMPQSIYHYEPNLDKLAIQSPPLLSLLSSRIMTSLSDAAWRAHEKLVIEEAKAKGGAYAALRPEIPGSVYRVRVAGLRPELWMELILWACLRGGWIEQGAEILRSIRHAWKPISWREHELKLIEQDDNGRADWETWEYHFKTRAPSASDAPLAADFHVAQTVSGEVVSAYVDALVSSVKTGVGKRGIDIQRVITHLDGLQYFLHKSRLGLTTGSWDTIIVRLIDSQAFDVDLQSQVAQDLVALSPGIQKRLPSHLKNHGLPDYVFDGNVAMQGLLHRILQSQIKSGHFEAAALAFRTILSRADNDRRAVIREFFRGEKSVMNLAAKDGMFTGNFSGIDYPAMDLPIPATILGSLLSLATDSKAYDFAHWLIHNNDVDGPLIQEDMYSDPHIQPALLRFAADTDDQRLLSIFKSQGLRRESVRAVLDSQINAKRWDTVIKILEQLSQTQPEAWSQQNLAGLACAILNLTKDARTGSDRARRDLVKARALFAAMVEGRYDGLEARSRRKATRIQTILSVLSTIDAEWGQYCTSLQDFPRFHAFDMNATAFNKIMEGVVASYGSAAGRRLLGIFWPHAARSATDNSSAFGSRQTARMSRSRPSVLNSIRRQKIEIGVRGTDKRVVVYQAVAPNTRTILIILEKALAELQRSAQPLQADSPDVAALGESSSHSESMMDATPRGIVAWAVRRLAELPQVEHNLVAKLDAVLAEHDAEDIRAELPRIVRQVEMETATDLDVIDGTADEEVDSDMKGIAKPAGPTVASME